MNKCPECGEEHEYVSIHIQETHKVKFLVYSKNNDYTVEEYCKECGKKLKLPAAENSNGICCSSMCKQLYENPEDTESITCPVCNKTIYANSKLFAYNLLAYHAKSIHDLKVQQIYDEMHKDDETSGKCKNCGKQCVFTSLHAGYRSFCSKACTVKYRSEHSDKNKLTTEEYAAHLRDLRRKAKAAFDARHRMQRIKEQEAKMEYQETVEENLSENYDQSIKWVGRGRENSLIDYQEFGTVTEWC